MKRLHVVLLAAAGCLCLSGSVAAQFGTGLFSKPNIADIFKPVVGSGAAMKDELAKWHQVGSETITVPAGTFSCAHLEEG
jgi:hypothetical protein